jgi:hypothetical protein
MFESGTQPTVVVTVLEQVLPVKLENDGRVLATGDIEALLWVLGGIPEPNSTRPFEYYVIPEAANGGANDFALVGFGPHIVSRDGMPAPRMAANRAARAAFLVCFGASEVITSGIMEWEFIACVRRRFWIISLR